ncbi:hypothetical protein [Massilia horti]|uniref:Type I restriction modification DNA specificity domain-containing protein n=1 Tax=Massilia horti TaxID=2562153 RepID=A0A4Y9T7K9_9BURK|nr:hypothetical protein [Massilia horti]TFW33592.1 hypothetical protein E4O92_06255 [Massilia horti]
MGYKGPLFYAHPGDLVISKIRVAQGSLCVVPDDLDHLAVSAEYPVYTVDPAKVSAEFIRMVIRTSAFKHRVGRLRSGNTTKARVRPVEFEALTIPLPDLAEQKVLLDAYHTALGDAEKLEAEAVQIAQASQRVFEDALGVASPPPLPNRPAFIARFKDVERWSHEGVLRAMTQSEQPIAKWPLMALGDFADLENGWSPKCLDHPASPSHWGVLKVGAVSFGQYDETENKELPAKLKPLPHFEVKSGDVIISRANVTRYVGACAYVEKTRPQLMLCDKLFRVIFKDDGKLDGRFLAAVMKLPTVREQIETQLTGTSPTMKNISKPALLGLRFPVPEDIDTQRALIKKLNEGAQAAKAKNLEAVELRRVAWAKFEAALFVAAA